MSRFVEQFTIKLFKKKPFCEKSLILKAGLEIIHMIHHLGNFAVNEVLFMNTRYHNMVMTMSDRK
jgi:hypothetical protein